jgi:hypothetical protein
MQGIVINGISKCKDWKICMKNMHSIFLKYHANIGGKDIPILAKVRSNYTNQIGSRSLHIHKSLLIFPSKMYLHIHLQSSQETCELIRKMKCPHKSMHSIFSNSMGIFVFAFHFLKLLWSFLFYFILFYFSPWYLTSTLNWSHRKKIKQLIKTSNGLHAVQQRPQGPLLLQNTPALSAVRYPPQNVSWWNKGCVTLWPCRLH